MSRARPPKPEVERPKSPTAAQAQATPTAKPSKGVRGAGTSEPSHVLPAAQPEMWRAGAARALLLPVKLPGTGRRSRSPGLELCAMDAARLRELLEAVKGGSLEID